MEPQSDMEKNFQVIRVFALQSGESIIPHKQMPHGPKSRIWIVSRCWIMGFTLVGRSPQQSAFFDRIGRLTFQFDLPHS